MQPAAKNDKTLFLSISSSSVVECVRNGETETILRLPAIVVIIASSSSFFKECVKLNNIFNKINI